jgi:peroxiredoxin
MPVYLIVLLTFGWLAILVGGWLGWQLLRQNGRLLLRLDELEKRLNELEFGKGEQPAALPVGSEAPAFELPDLAGEAHTLAQYRGQALMLIFFNPACGFCRELAPKLKDKTENEKQKAQIRQSRTGGRPDEPLVLIISTGEVETNRALFGERELAGTVLLQKTSEVAAAYQANGTPSGYLITAEGRIASGLAMGAEALLELAEGKVETRNQKAGIDKAAGNGVGREARFSNRSLARSKLKRDGLRAGTVAPEFRLPRLDGRGELALSDLRGRRVLLVFSSPTCGPCLELSPHFEKFHRMHPELEVVMISKGEPKENRAKVKEQGLTLTIVLQQQWEISRKYAMFATPIAYLIDEQGVIAHDVAVGTDAILALLTEARLQAGRGEPLPRSQPPELLSTGT